MAKTSSSFVCQDCGYESSQWLGRCPECGQWNSFKQFKIQKQEARSKNQGSTSQISLTPKTLKEIDIKQTPRFSTGFTEMDTVFGGGIVNGSVTLIAGDPGIGKSTLLLQMAINISKEMIGAGAGSKPHPASGHLLLKGEGKKVLYISGEESLEQIKLRASRITEVEQLDSLVFLSLSQVDAIIEVVAQIKPDLVIIDSIQTMESEEAGGLSGSVSQVRFAASSFIRTAKQFGIPHIMVGHVTKEGMVAGPMLLSHMVDTVLFLEGEKFTSTRILRSLKNRFGPVDEVGIFVMDEKGLQEVTNPEQVFLQPKKEASSGSVLVVVMEGTRPFLIEIQALVVYSKLPMPRRVVSGVDHKRVELLLAVLQKHCRLPVETMDVFVNIAGGIKVDDPAADLGICLAVYSSLKNKDLSRIIGIGEVGLLGELRTTQGLEKRIREAKKLGFTNIITSDRYKTLSAVLKEVE